MITNDKIMQALKEVVDPEIGLNAVDLNIIRDVNIGDKEIEIKLVLTTPYCPLAGFIVDNVKKKAMEVAEGREVDVVVLNEPWIPPDRLRGQRK